MLHNSFAVGRTACASPRFVCFVANRCNLVDDLMKQVLESLENGDVMVAAGHTKD